MRLTMMDYLTTVQGGLQAINLDTLEQAVHAIFGAYLDGRTVFTMGNGASAALAAHMACDLAKGTATDVGRGPAAMSERRLRVICLNDNLAMMTAYSNDLAYEDVYLEQLKNLLSEGDIVIGISGSGGSPNVLRAMRYAHDHGAVTIGLTGAQPSARLIGECSDLLLDVPLTLIEQIEDAHVVLHHIITVNLRAMIAADVTAGQLRSQLAGGM